MSSRTPVAAVEGWFTMDAERPALLGNRCTSCGGTCFPKASFSCPNPSCGGTEFVEVELSRRGTVWSYTDARYQPPPPYLVPPGGHEPFAIAAVQLAAEGLVVMGQMVAGTSLEDVSIGSEVELVLDTLWSDDEHDHLVWKWALVPTRTDAAQ